MYQSILVPIDGSEHAEQALKVACRLASGSDATLHLLYVPVLGLGDDEFGYIMGAAATDQLVRRAEANGEQLLEKTVESLGDIGPKVKSAIQWGSPARVIVDQAHDLGVDAIIMGSRGLSDLKGLAVGSVSHKVMHIAECRVITVH